MRKFTKYPQGYVKADSKKAGDVTASQKIVAYVTPEEDRAWGLLDAWFEREWGEIPYNESARQILIDEFPWDYNVSEDGSDWEEGTGAVVLNLKDHEVSYRCFEDDMREKVIKYSSLDELINDFIQPLHDGTITGEDLRERCEDYLY